MVNNFSFDEFDSSNNQNNNSINEQNDYSIDTEKEDEKFLDRKKINFKVIPQTNKDVFPDVQSQQQTQNQLIEKYTKEESIPSPYEVNNFSSYLTLVLSPNLRELELMIRGLEYAKRYNPISNQEEIILRKISNHPLNEYGINKIMEFLKIYASPEIKLGRKRTRDYYNSVQEVSRAAIRLIYKNLKNFGMDTQVKQRSAKTFALAIIEIVDASFSRSIEGKENDLSRATEMRIEGSLDGINDPAKMFNRTKKDAMKN